MKILISGGHLTPALALIDHVRHNHPTDKIIFVGRTHSQHQLKQLAHEQHEVEQRGAKFIPLQATKTSHHRRSWRRLPQLSILATSVQVSLKIIKHHQPDIFVSFGGYLAVPLAIAAKIQRVPIITHEQTRSLGLANQVVARLANKVALSHPSSAPWLSTHKTILTGNPLRPELFDQTPPQPQWIKKQPSKPVLLITGGSQGAQIINHTMEHLLPQLTLSWTLIHLCGRASAQHNSRQQLQQAARQLPPAQAQNYYVREWISSQDMAWVYHQAHAAIARAGANTVAEIMHENIPTIFIPLPFAHHNEQLKNAQLLADQAAALILPQELLSPDSLLEKIAILKKNHSQLKTKLKSITINPQAVHKLYQLIATYAV